MKQFQKLLWNSHEVFGIAIPPTQIISVRVFEWLAGERLLDENWKDHVVNLMTNVFKDSMFNLIHWHVEHKNQDDELPGGEIDIKLFVTEEQHYILLKVL